MSLNDDKTLIIHMKLIFSLIVCIVSLFTSYGQTNFVLDQSSGSDNWTPQRALSIKAQPMGQSFKPTLPSVGFVKFYVGDNNTETHRPSSVYINLRLETLTGSIIGKSDQVYLPDGFSGISTFYFSNGLPVTPGLVYCFQPILNSDNGTVHFGYGSDMENYLGGSAFIEGERLTSDLWFREGIMEIPEPDSYILTCLIISICVGLSCIDRKKP